MLVISQSKIKIAPFESMYISSELRRNCMNNQPCNASIQTIRREFVNRRIRNFDVEQTRPNGFWRESNTDFRSTCCHTCQRRPICPISDRRFYKETIVDQKKFFLDVGKHLVMLHNGYINYLSSFSQLPLMPPFDLIMSHNRRPLSSPKYFPILDILFLGFLTIYRQHKFNLRID